MKIILRLLLITCFTVISSGVLYAQQVFTKVYYDIFGTAQAYSTIKTFDNNYLIAGERNYSSFIMKIDLSGNIIWSNNYSNSYGERFNQIISTNDSNYFAVGTVLNTATNNMDAFCVKINSNGDVLWSRMIDFGVDDIAFSVQQTYDNGYVIIGNEYNTQYNFVIKLDSIGDLLWSEKLTSVNSNNSIYSVKQTPDSGYVVIGNTFFGSPLYSNQPFITKLAQNGSVSWSKMTQLQNNFYNFGFDIIVSQDGFIMYIYDGNYSLEIIKTDLSGNVTWSKDYSYTFFGSLFQGYPAPKMHATSDGGFAIINSTSYSFGGHFLKIDSIGNIQISEDLFLLSTDVIETDDKGFLVIGNGPIMGVKMSPSNDLQIGVMKLDSVGTTYNCLTENNYVTNNDTLNLYPITFNKIIAGTISSFVPFYSPTVLDIVDNECVTFLGNANENKRKQKEIQLFPNPSDGIFEISTDKTDDINTIKIFDMLGNIVYEISDSEITKSKIDISHLPDGMYFIQVEFSDKKCIEKMIISR